MASIEGNQESSIALPGGLNRKVLSFKETPTVGAARDGRAKRSRCSCMDRPNVHATKCPASQCISALGQGTALAPTLPVKNSVRLNIPEYCFLHRSHWFEETLLFASLQSRPQVDK